MSLSSQPIPRCASCLDAQVGGREGRGEVRVRTRVERPSVQILVVVASIQMRTLKTEVEQAFM